ncbi:MFS general substrate transporter [Punctularia strigosozonata HHB-11173 SS5]|uniref:MFS general substrate transporter n=1 Tax=Punctularia strigosozonata (strain HHB-11173) TaxID=741275 RepID=UPI0004416854|nr:MFS general substrate transporter [Punctularia strigosozonata HHB-11173 SS5]EIN14540.1 MFS general substrate transporter [Punctularia strigosozonata HHB-11173 SS5]
MTASGPTYADFEKGDFVLKESCSSNEAASYSEQDSRRLVWRQDVRIIPLACVVYLLCYLDRSNIGNAKVAAEDKGHSLEKDLSISTGQYNAALMLFFVAYMIFETPSNILLKKIGPAPWIAFITCAWGIVTMCLGAVQNFAGLAVVRFLLGAIEAGLFPGFVYYLTFWYRPEERSVRVALILASATLAGAFGGALGTGITFMDDVSGIHAWRWIFILEGIPSIICSVIVWFCLPNYPETSSWLSEEEKALAAVRLTGDNSSHGSHELTWAEAKETLTDWRLYVHYLAYIGISAPFSSLSLFAPTIVAGLDYKGIDANLFTVPPYAVAWVFTVAVAFAADRWNRRALASGVTSLIASISFLLLAALDGDRFKARYGLLVIATTFSFACIPPLLGWLSSNLRGTTSVTLGVPLNISAGAIGQIVGVWIYKSNEKPAFKTGNYTNFAFLLMTSALCGVLTVQYRRRNQEIIRNGSDQRLWVL